MKNNFFGLILCLFASTALFGCSNNESSDDRSYTDLTNNQLGTLDDFYTKSTDKYFVMIYMETCPHCENIKDVVFNYVASLEGSNNPNIYLFDMGSRSTDIGLANRARFKSTDDLTGSTTDEKVAQANTNMLAQNANTLANTYYFGVPGFYVVENNTFSKLIVGETIGTYLTDTYLNKSTQNAWIIGGTVAAGAVIITTIVVLLVKYKK
jgi:hypothetical protein